MTTETQTAPTHRPEVPDRGGYMPIATLWTAAVDVLTEWDKSIDQAEMAEAMQKLRDAIAKITEARNDAKALSEITDEANGYRLGDDGDVDIIGDWTHHNGWPAGDGGGYWVDAWVWVEDEGPDEELESDEREATPGEA